MTTMLGVTLPDSWPKSRLKYVSTMLQRGSAPNYMDNGPVRAISQAANQENGIDWGRTRFHDFSGDVTKLKGHLLPGDVIINSTGTGTLGRVGYFTGPPDATPCMADGHLTIARAKASELYSRFAYYWLRSRPFQDYVYAALAVGATNQIELNRDRLGDTPIPLPPLNEQHRIANFLDAEVAKIDTLISKKLALIAILEERIDSRILNHIGASRLVNSESGLLTAPIKRLLPKVSRLPIAEGEILTAFRDGQVTARSQRRAAGYTLASTTDAQGQYVKAGDVVIHGLDGFAGAIGTAEVPGNCSPVYHVCVPSGGGDPFFFGRLLRVLAISEYLGLFATSTRERAVDFRNWDLFGNIPIPIVPLPEQAEMGAWIRAIRPLRVAVERSNALGAERRQALITAAVTGQFDVSTASGRGIED